MIDPRIAAACALTAAAMVGAAGCGSSSTTTTRTVTGIQTTTVTTTGTATGAPTPTGPAARNLHVSDAFRERLLIVGALANSLPPVDFAGLVPGRTYYAFDTATDTHWAGAQLIASSKSAAGRAAVINDGAYLLFSKSGGGRWRAYRVGMTGAYGEGCPVEVPSGVLAVWGWAPGSCKAPG
jgi:hypothetical protein